MSENWELAPSSINNDMAEMQRKLRSISEMERVLNERSVRREACRYLLDAHRILSRDALRRPSYGSPPAYEPLSRSNGSLAEAAGVLCSRSGLRIFIAPRKLGLTAARGWAVKHQLE